MRIYCLVPKFDSLQDFISATKRIRIKTPRQNNSNDCGLYTIMYAKNLLNSWKNIRSVETEKSYEDAFEWIKPEEVDKERTMLIALFEEKLNATVITSASDTTSEKSSIEEINLVDEI